MKEGRKKDMNGKIVIERKNEDHVRQHSNPPAGFVHIQHNRATNDKVCKEKQRKVFCKTYLGETLRRRLLLEEGTLLVIKACK